jgi:hypothetical protein
MTPPAVQPETDLLLDQLARCALVVTDTYHVAINAWRVGTPAICIVDRPRSSWSVNSGELDGRRDKREDLYSQLDALGLLVAGTGSLRNLDHEVDRVRAHLADPARVELVHLRVDALTARSRAALSDAIGHLVQRERA